MPATEVQRIAAAAYKGGLRHGEISRLAALGQRGNYPGNIHQQLNTMLGRNSLPQPMVLEIPCVDPKTSEVALADCGVLLPHEWFSALFHRYETEFNYIFGVDRLGEFWANASSAATIPWASHALFVRCPGIVDKIIPGTICVYENTLYWKLAIVGPRVCRSGSTATGPSFSRETPW
eukprot:9497789-Pyramimonas_sp.AAC.1